MNKCFGNEILWSNYAAFSQIRGTLVASVLSQKMCLRDAHILDVGCGAGGISCALAREGAIVKAIDPEQTNVERLKELCVKYNVAVDAQLMSIEEVQEKSMFDAVVLWDVLEHLKQPKRALQLINLALKPGGMLLLSSPNKWSPLNWICDPHYSLPFVALLPRSTIRVIVAHRLKWLPSIKTDYAELLSFNKIARMLESLKYEFSSVNALVCHLALKQPEGLWNRPFHFLIVNKIKKYLPEKRILFLDNLSFSRYINPTIFIMAQRN